MLCNGSKQIISLSSGFGLLQTVSESDTMRTLSSRRGGL